MRANIVLCQKLASDQLESDSILHEARLQWADVSDNYRDGCLRVGDTVRRYLIARLTEGADGDALARLDYETRRVRAVEDAAAQLDVDNKRCHELIRAAAVVRVLGDPGRLCYSSVVRLGIFVTRSQESEDWAAKLCSGHDPAKVYGKIVRENWGVMRVRDFIQRVPIARRGRQPLGRVEVACTAVSWHSIAERATPKDLVEMIANMVRASPAAAEVRAMLRAFLAGVPA